MPLQPQGNILHVQPDPLELRLRTAGLLGFLRVWLPVLLVISVIAIESTDTFSAANTSSWLRPRLETLLGPIRDRNWELFHHLLRKTGHFCGYGLVSLAWLRAWLFQLGRIPDMARDRWRRLACLLAIVATSAVASADEIHQSLIPSRTGQLSDVGLDTLGASATCVLVWFFVWRRKKGRRRSRS